MNPSCFELSVLLETYFSVEQPHIDERLMLCEKPSRRHKLLPAQTHLSSCAEKHMTLRFCLPKYAKVERMQISHNAQGKASFM